MKKKIHLTGGFVSSAENAMRSLSHQCWSKLDTPHLFSLDAFFFKSFSTLCIRRMVQHFKNFIHRSKSNIH